MTKRLLSLDGGGTWALVQVAALIQLYDPETTGRQVLRDFDLVVANSGGALVLAALFEDFPLAEIETIFKNSALLGQLFSSMRGKWLPRLFKWLPRYATQTKLDMLRESLPKAASTKMSEVSAALGGGTDLMLISFDYDTQRAVFTRSGEGSPSLDSPHQRACELTLVDAVHGSSTPPVHYFDRPASTSSQRSRRLWDGALGGYNNPTVAGICELLAQPDVRPEAIEVLSLGTGQIRQFSHRTAELLRARNPDVVIPPAAIMAGGDPINHRWLRRTMKDLEKLSTAILDDPPDAATYVAFVLLGHKPTHESEPTDLRLVRMNPVLCPLERDGRWILPTHFADPRKVAQLAELDLDAHREDDIELIASFARAWITADVASELPNQGVRQHWDSSLHLGDPTFAAAKRRWQALKARATLRADE